MNKHSSRIYMTRVQFKHHHHHHHPD
ncbi:hypothetical protein BWZ29_17610 [Enterobacter cancerogenus]|nr:his operon leader peptide [Enterobacter roggenkampii]OOC88296.1 hypothetical protein BWP06_11850 [Enterobacter cloacae]OOV70993.1 his operon leader peptide [Enterobacter kobei]OQD48881.1 hypothetical protein BWZ29_17610 [Enterobacter cancerogenus]